MTLDEAVEWFDKFADRMSVNAALEAAAILSGDKFMAKEIWSKWEERLKNVPED